MMVVATLPPVIALQLIDELEAAGIPARSTDMAPGIGIAAYPGLLETTITVWVLDEADLEAASRILQQMQDHDWEDTDEDDSDPADEPPRPDPKQTAARRRNAHVLALLFFTGPVGLVVILILFALLYGGLG